MARRSRIAWHPMVLVFLTVVCALPKLSAAPADFAAFYVDNYGLANQEQPEIARAHNVFARMKAVAALPGGRSPELFIVATEGDPWAQAIPDGNVILSRRAVEICYEGVEQQVGDARLAFVLGHELAHLAKDDFWHSRVHRALAGEPGTERIMALLERTSDADFEQFEETRAKEAQADDWGMLYAGLAGYQVDQLLSDPSGRKDFFTYWLEQTHTRAEHDPRHPLPEDREVMIRARLAEVLGDLEYYRFGVRLISFERFEEAQDFLEAFEATFPAPEVLGNLGYLNLRLAINAMPAKLAFRYWMPTLFDITSRADRLSLPGRGDKLPPAARTLLERAVDYLDRATAADPDYRPAWMNLAVARFYLGDVSLALFAVGEAARLAPDDVGLPATQAVLLANLDPNLDMGPQAIARLDALIADGAENPVARYNLARLLDERDDERSAVHWQWLQANAASLPAPYYREVCSGVARCVTTPQPEVALPWDLPAAPGTDLYESQATKELLSSPGWQSDAFDFQRPGMRGTLYWRSGAAAVLDLDNYVDMVVLYGGELGTAADLTAKLGEPSSVESVRGGQLWRYGSAWTAVVRDRRVTEVWVDETDNR